MDEADVQPRVRSDTGDARRRQKFKERSKVLQKEFSTPKLMSTWDAKAPLPLSSHETVAVGHGLGHEFAKKTFFQPTFCHHCTEMLWGLKGQGFVCTGKRRKKRRSRREREREREGGEGE